MSGVILLDTGKFDVRFKPSSQLYPYIRIALHDDEGNWAANDYEESELDDLEQFAISITNAVQDMRRMIGAKKV